MIVGCSADWKRTQMSNAFQVWNNWLSLASQAVMLPLQTQSAMALRLLGIAGDGALARSEATRMLTEEEQPPSEEQAAAAVGSVTSRNHRHIGKKSMTSRNRRHIANKSVTGRNRRHSKKVAGVYKKRIRGNRRQLTR
jgi:hypothetical protein